MTANAILLTSKTCAFFKPFKSLVVELTQKLGIPLDVCEVCSQSPLAKAFQIRALPTLILLDEHGQEFCRLVGYLSRAELEEYLKQ